MAVQAATFGVCCCEGSSSFFLSGFGSELEFRMNTGCESPSSFFLIFFRCNFALKFQLSHPEASRLEVCLWAGLLLSLYVADVALSEPEHGNVSLV